MYQYSWVTTLPYFCRSPPELGTIVPPPGALNKPTLEESSTRVGTSRWNSDVNKAERSTEQDELARHEALIKELEDGLPGKRHSNTRIFGTMLVAATISLIAAFVLSIDAVALAANPTADLACDVNAILSCGTVGTSWQATAFGFHNAFLGLIFESMVITMALIGISGVKIPRWLAVAEQIIYIFALVFAIWLFYQSMFSIGALCPWCLAITYFTMIVFLSLLHYNIREDNIWRTGKGRARARAFIRNDGDLYVGIGWFVLVTAAILMKYGPAVLGL